VRLVAEQACLFMGRTGRAYRVIIVLQIINKIKLEPADTYLSADLISIVSK
jgi:hypothetical protein